MGYLESSPYCARGENQIYVSAIKTLKLVFINSALGVLRKIVLEMGEFSCYSQPEVKHLFIQKSCEAFMWLLSITAITVSVMSLLHSQIYARCGVLNITLFCESQHVHMHRMDQFYYFEEKHDISETEQASHSNFDAQMPTSKIS